MTEAKANKRLRERHDFYFSKYHNHVTRYAAVIKKSNNSRIKDDFLIEIGFDKKGYELDKHLLLANSKSDFLKRLGVAQEFIAESEKGELKIDFVPEIEYQNEDIYEESKQKYEKLTAGISVFDIDFNGQSGTAGAFFNITNSDDIYMISNFHVLLEKFYSDDNNFICHPSKSDDLDNYSKIGEVIWKKNISKVKNNYMDAAIAIINYPVDTGKYTRCEQIILTGIGGPSLGDNIKKCGKKTGLTCGEIRSINCTVNVSRTQNDLDVYYNQIMTNKISCKGDSGSILVNDKNVAVGLLFAGNNKMSFANNLEMIFEEVKKDMPKFIFKNFV